MANEVTRYIKTPTQMELWGKAAGRCQFKGCNNILYRSHVTLEQVNAAEKAHIYSFSKNGPRGWGAFVINKGKLNNIDNLMLMCHTCHKTVDQDKEGLIYSAELLQKWKKEHENRVRIVTGIDPKNKTHIIFYAANIGEQKSLIQKDDAYQAIFPHHFPVDENPIMLSMVCSHEDKDANYWVTENSHLAKDFQQKILPKIEGNSPAHFSVFSIAPMPLLIQLGALFTDKISVDIYQPIREPKTWCWQDAPEEFKFNITEPETNHLNPVLIMSLSAQIDRDRIKAVIGDKIDVWEMTVPKGFQHNDFIRSSTQLSLFRQEMRKLIANIAKRSGNTKPLHVFPAMPVSCSVEMGRIRMPKADMPWIIYDQNNKKRQFIKALEIQEI